MRLDVVLWRFRRIANQFKPPGTRTPTLGTDPVNQIALTDDPLERPRSVDDGNRADPALDQEPGNSRYRFVGSDRHDVYRHDILGNHVILLALRRSRRPIRRIDAV